jgi:hypothetical protein
MIRACALIAFFFTVFPSFAASQPQAQALTPYQSQIEAGPNENFDYAATQLWMPIVPAKTRGVLCIILHPLARGGSILAYPQPWIEMARKENCALMAISFAQSDDATRDWCRADQGTGRALLASLTNISHQSRVPALADSPLVVVGVCAAGQFAYHLAAFAPTRVVSFVTIGGGKHDLSKFRATTSIPALLVTTPDRGSVPVQNLLSLYTEGKTLSAPWEITSEPIAQYDAGLCSLRVISYLRQRLGDLGKSPGRGDADLNKSAYDWLPISICGVKLPEQVFIAPLTRSLGTINSNNGIQKLSFIVETTANSQVDYVFPINSDNAFQLSLTKESLRLWHLECRLDPNNLPLGPSNLVIKIRFSARGKQLLGEARANLSGFVAGSLNWQPHVLNFGSVKPGHAATAFMKICCSNEGAIQIEGVTSPYPWIKVTNRLVSDDNIIKCVVTVPSAGYSQGFAGYLFVKLRVPQHRSLKILCFGSVNAKT